MISNQDKVKIPWQDKPTGSQDVMWRYSKNPYQTGKDAEDSEKFEAWSNGFKAHFDVACCEAW